MGGPDKTWGLELAPKALVGDLLEQATPSISHRDIRLSDVTAALWCLPERSRRAMACPWCEGTHAVLTGEGGGATQRFTFHQDAIDTNWIKET